MRRLLIRPGAIGDFIVSLPALEALRGDYTEVWCAEQNVPLARFANRAVSLGTAGLNRLGVLPTDDVTDRLRSFDSIVTWSAIGREQLLSIGVPVTFLKALPTSGVHASTFYNGQARELGGTPTWTPALPCPILPRTFAVIHPFASSVNKRLPLALFQEYAARLAGRMPVYWLAGPEEELATAVRLPDLYELACWLAGARVYIGNDSGISHLAAAVGTPVLALFAATRPREWSPRGSVAASHRYATK